MQDLAPADGAHTVFLVTVPAITWQMMCDDYHLCLIAATTKSSYCSYLGPFLFFSDSYNWQDRRGVIQLSELGRHIHTDLL